MKILKLIVLFSLVLSCLQCKKDGNDHLPECENCNFDCLEGTEEDIFTNVCKDNFDCQYNLHPNAALEYVEGEFLDEAKVNAGDKLVFETILDTQGDPLIIDDELKEFLYFEIDTTQESFDAESDDLDLLNVRFQQYCFCADVHYKKPTNGCMQGQRIDATHWKVQANLEFTYEFGKVEVRMDGVYSY